MNERRFYVYVHKAAIDFILNGRNYTKGVIVYVGSGTNGRYTSKKNRSEDHLSVWDFIEKEIIVQDLKSDEKFQKEEAIIALYWKSGLLFNKRKNTHPINTIQYSDVCEYFEISEDVPSGLIWKKSIRGTRGIGEIAGNLGNFGYWRVCLKGRILMVSRIVWTLANKKDIPCEMCIDHIDNNPSNNSIKNLRCVTTSDNNKNRRRNSNSGFDRIYWISKDQTWMVVYNNTRKYFPYRSTAKIENIPLEEAKKMALDNAKKYLEEVKRNDNAK